MPAPVEEAMIPMPVVDVPDTAPPPPADAAPAALPTNAPPPPDIHAVSVDKRDYQPSAVQAVVELPPIAGLQLPSGLTMSSMMDGVDVEGVLRTIEGCPFGSSEGGWSPHKLGEATCRRRFYLRHVLGLKKIKRAIHFDFGTLFHACLAMRYLHGAARQFEPCEAVAHAGDAELAYDVKKLLLPMFDKYAKEEWETWCPRAIEYNMVAWLPCKIGKKTVMVPLSCRLDMVLALKRPEEPHPGPGPVPAGVYLMDWKTTSAITYDLITAYGMDYQFLVQCAIFKLGNYEQVFGPLRGIYVGLAAKRSKEPGYDDYQRIESPMSNDVVDDFIVHELVPTVTELHEMFMDDKTVADISCWPKDKRLCVGRWGACDFFNYCDRSESVDYVVDEHHIITPDFFRKPPTDYRPAEIPGLELAIRKTKAKPAAAKGKPEDTEEAGILAASIGHQIETDDIFAALRKENFLTPGHTFQSVQRALSASLKQFYLSSALAKTKFHMAGHEWKYQKTGIAWVKNTPGGEGKGRVTWSALSARICKDYWFNLSTVMPK
jgi:hypothetical protein